MINVAWDPGPKGWVSLNTDDSFDRARQKATAGGILRDHTGKFILAFSMNLGSCSVTRAEMRKALEGLRRTWEVGFRNFFQCPNHLNSSSKSFSWTGILHERSHSQKFPTKEFGLPRFPFKPQINRRSRYGGLHWFHQ
ncbi:Putative ribonuclease H protein At1g65750 [Linum perenne]